MTAESDDPAEHPPLRRTTIRGARLALTGYALSRGMMFGVYLVLARLISPADFGHFAAASVFIGVGALFVEGGMMSALIRHRDRLDEAASTAFASLLVSGILDDRDRARGGTAHRRVLQELAGHAARCGVVRGAVRPGGHDRPRCPATEALLVHAPSRGRSSRIRGILRGSDRRVRQRGGSMGARARHLCLDGDRNGGLMGLCRFQAAPEPGVDLDVAGARFVRATRAWLESHFEGRHPNRRLAAGAIEGSIDPRPVQERLPDRAATRRRVCQRGILRVTSRARPYRARPRAAPRRGAGAARCRRRGGAPGEPDDAPPGRGARGPPPGAEVETRRSRGCRSVWPADRTRDDLRHK